MKKIEFTTTINANPKKIWQVLWNDLTYRQWANVFYEGSYAVSDWQQGSKIKFLGPSGDGMFSLIEECNAPERMVFKHLGEIKNLKEDPESEGSKNWNGSREIYEITKEKERSTLKVSLDSTDEFLTYFQNAFPKALEVIKQLAEQPVVITVEAKVNAPIDKIWAYWTEPKHIVNWNNASDEWHTPRATNDLKIGGKFLSRMESKDGSMGFDFEGIYTAIEQKQKIEYRIADGRSVSIDFIKQHDGYRIVEAFEAEEENSFDLQQGGWQAILNNFKKSVEKNDHNEK